MQKLWLILFGLVIILPKALLMSNQRFVLHHDLFGKFNHQMFFFTAHGDQNGCSLEHCSIGNATKNLMMNHDRPTVLLTGYIASNVSNIHGSNYMSMYL